MNERDDLYAAGRLIQWALRPDARPTTNPEYHKLITRYLDQLSFRAIVQAIAEGLGLRALDAGPFGFVLVPIEASVFEMKLADYRNSPGLDDRLLDGLIQVAILVTVFPRAQDLEEDSAIVRPPIMVEEVESTLRQLCEQLEMASRGAPDLASEEQLAGLYSAWRVYSNRPSVMETRDERRGARSTLAMIEHGLEFLRRQGCFTRSSHQNKQVYQPTRRYQLMAQELMVSQLYSAVSAMRGAS